MIPPIGSKKFVCNLPISSSSTKSIPATYFEIEHSPAASVVSARRIIQFELVVEPRILVAENVTEPIEHETDRTSIQTFRERDQVKRNGNPEAHVQRYNTRLDQGVATKQPNSVPC